jgi:hypothetical protein
MRWIIVDKDGKRQDGNDFASAREAERYIIQHAPGRHGDLFVVPEFDSRNRPFRKKSRDA